MRNQKSNKKDGKNKKDSRCRASNTEEKMANPSALLLIYLHTHTHMHRQSGRPDYIRGGGGGGSGGGSLSLSAAESILHGLCALASASAQQCVVVVGVVV